MKVMLLCGYTPRSSRRSRHIDSERGTLRQS